MIESYAPLGARLDKDTLFRVSVRIDVVAQDPQNAVVSGAKAIAQLLIDECEVDVRDSAGRETTWLVRLVGVSSLE